MQKLPAVFLFLALSSGAPIAPAWSQAATPPGSAPHATWAPTAEAGPTAAAAQSPRTHSPADIVDAVKAFLLDVAGQHQGLTHIAVDTPRLGPQPFCTDLQPHLSGRQTLRPRMTVTVRCLAPVTWITHVQASVRLEGQYYVARRSIQAGEAVRTDDLSHREGDLLRLPGDTILEPESAVGFIASQRIPAGTTIKSRMLRDPGSIARGQAVRTEVRGPGFLATGEGQALESGAPGSRVQVRASSGQIITGVVLDAHTVRVMM